MFVWHIKGLEFDENADSDTVIGYYGVPKDIVVPSTYLDKPVTSVNIPESVTSISSEAFYGCINLSELTIPISVTNV